jgi:hypothetical protein
LGPAVPVSPMPDTHMIHMLKYFSFQHATVLHEPLLVQKAVKHEMQETLLFGVISYALG